ncbi:hypothetical protein Efla_002671 [Eimeria flavescens]
MSSRGSWRVWRRWFLLLLVFVSSATVANSSPQSFFNRLRAFFIKPKNHETPAGHVVLQVSSAEQRARIDEILAEVEKGERLTYEGLKHIFVSLLKAAGKHRHDRQLKIDALVHTLVRWEERVYRLTIMVLASYARRLHLVFPKGLPYLTRENPVLHLTRIQLFALLAASFFGIIPDQQVKTRSGADTVRFNKLDFFYRGFFNREDKFRGLLSYFTGIGGQIEGCWQEMVEKNSFTARSECSIRCNCTDVTFNGRKTRVAVADEIVSFYLHTPDPASFALPGGGGQRVKRPAVSASEVVESEKPLTPLTVDVDGDILKSDGDLQLASSFQVAFASRFIGGLSMFGDHFTPEEILFSVRPELLAAMLFVPALSPAEALVVKGAQTFAGHTGRGSSFHAFSTLDVQIPAGSHWSFYTNAPLDFHGRRDTTVLIMDAAEYGGIRESQYAEAQIMREILKASLAFQGDPLESTVSNQVAAVATGKWGCDDSGGDNELKSLLQWIAASYEGRAVHFKGFGEKDVAGMEATLTRISKKFPTISSLYHALQKCTREKKATKEQGWSLWQALLHL